MEMKDRLPCLWAGVDHQSEAAFSNASLMCHHPAYQYQVTSEGFIFRLELIQRGNVFAGNDQQMDGCHGMGIGDDNYLRIFKQDLGRYFTGDNLAEDAVFHEDKRLQRPCQFRNKKRTLYWISIHQGAF